MTQDHGFDALAAELCVAFECEVEAPWPEERFDALARRVFRVQFEGCPVYRGFCEGRGVREPGAITSYGEIPPVPATAFKYLDLVVGDPSLAEATYRTSGTTRGSQARGRHSVRSLSLYRASCLPMFARDMVPAVLSDAGVAPDLVSLIPSPGDAPDSSLSAMIGMVAEELADRTEWLVGGAGDFHVEALARAIEDRADGPPLMMVGTALSFTNAIEAMQGRSFALPEGSRIMETGGFKGAGREVSREVLYEGIRRAFSVPEDAIVSEYGMTELLSQLYRTASSGAHRAPPWLRVRALDPVTLEPVPEEEPGLLCFYDLANLGSVSAVLTEDWGRVVGVGVELLGRVSGAEPRGCSRAMDELMSVRRTP